MDPEYLSVNKSGDVTKNPRKGWLARIVPNRRVALCIAGVLITAIVLTAVFVSRAASSSDGDKISSGTGVPSGTVAGDKALLGDDSAGPVVNLGYTTYQGKWQPNGIAQFTGMRYAKAPLGDLRWRAPIEPETMSNIQKATGFGKACYGTSAGMPADQSEDCLFVNVWAPQKVTARAKLPVWLFVQGGGYNSNSAPYVLGSEVIEKSGYNAIVVTFNYRVSLFGFLASEKIKADGALNAGLLDQRFLMEWVQKHIEAFGGDPEKVMLHGHSAGGGSVAHHLTAYGGRDDKLFSSAVLESPYYPTELTVVESEWQFNKTAELAGCGSHTDVLSCLRNIDVDTLQKKVNGVSNFPNKNGIPVFYWSPTVDGDFVSEDLMLAFGAGHYVKVPTLIGTVTNEGSLFAVDAKTQAEVTNFLSNNLARYNSSWTDTITKAYPQAPEIQGRSAWFPTASLAYGDVIFDCPSLVTGNAIASSLATMNGPALWMYRYNVTDEAEVKQGFGVPHSADLPAFFGARSMSTTVSQSYTTYNAPMVTAVMSYLISFLRTQNPNTLKEDGALEWDTWVPGQQASRLVLELNNTRHEELTQTFRSRCSDWDRLLKESLLS
ncbi:Lipase 1 [Ceratocystis fimbriata CBS 114723]|uniref:Carboxylic ester hydrolase n=1 Tax=Ceratocystis fimbriata CBS 114723 TaxID=1035309 RepID=A0A2C5XK72_9PEZI|nr:Lipase 1 [Ceratocystis fimbriata CBS 114723]